MNPTRPISTLLRIGLRASLGFVVIAGFLATATPVAATQLTFAPPVPSQVGATRTNVTTSDLNGDGLPGRAPLLESAVPKAEAKPVPETTVALSQKIMVSPLLARTASGKALSLETSGGTNVGGTISSDTTWTPAGSPYTMTSSVTACANQAARPA